MEKTTFKGFTNIGKGGEVVTDQAWTLHDYTAGVSLTFNTKGRKITKEMKEAGRLLAEVAITTKTYNCSFDVDDEKVTCIARISLARKETKK